MTFNPATSPKDILDRVMISQDAAERWARKAGAIAESMIISNPDLIPDEMARLGSSGTLILYVRMPDGIEISEVIPADDWMWMS